MYPFTLYAQKKKTLFILYECAGSSGRLLLIYDIMPPVLVLHAVEPQLLEHLWDHGNLFEIWVVQAPEG